MAFGASNMEQPSRVRPEGRFRGSAEEMRGYAEQNQKYVEPGGALLVPESAETLEQEEDIGDVHSPESIDRLLAYVQSEIEDRVEKTGLSAEAFNQSEAASSLSDFADLLEGMKTVAEDGELTDEDGEIVQAAYDRVMGADLNPIETIDQTEAFDPDQYIAEKFRYANLRQSERNPVYVLQQAYRAAVEKDNVKNAEELALQIKEYVDELVGVEPVEQEGIGVDLSYRRRGVDLQPVVLDKEDVDVITRVIDRTNKPTEQVKTGPLVLEQAARVHTADELVVNYDDNDQLSSEQKLQNDLAEFGVESLEPELAQELTPDPETETETSSSVTQESVQTSVISPREKAREAVVMKNRREQELHKIEGFSSNKFMSTLFNGESPYKALGEENFNDLFTLALETGSKRADFLRLLKNDNINEVAFNKWIDTLSELEDIDTAGKTFKEVADELIKARVESGNTQSA